MKKENNQNIIMMSKEKHYHVKFQSWALKSMNFAVNN